MSRATKSAARKLRQQAGVERDLVDAVADGGRRLGDALARDRVDLHDDRVAAIGFVEQRPQRRIAGIAAVPIGFAVDHGGLEQMRQRRRGHHMVGREDVAAKYCAHAGAHIGRGDEQFRPAALAKLLEIHKLRERVAQRIHIERVEGVGRERMRRRVCDEPSARTSPSTSRPRRRWPGIVAPGGPSSATARQNCASFSLAPCAPVGEEPAKPARPHSSPRRWRR